MPKLPFVLHFSTAQSTAHQIVLPLILLIAVVVASIIAVVFYSAQKANLDATISSERNVDAILSDRRSQLAALAKDYAYWDDTILNAFHSQDMQWIDKNIGRYLTDSFGISELLIIDSENRNVLSLQDGLPVGWKDTTNIQGGLEELIIRARESGPTPVPVSGILLIDAHPALVGASVLTPEGKDSMPVPTPRPVLVLAKRFDEPRLLEISQSFGLTGLRFQASDAHSTSAEVASLEINTLDRTVLGALVWTADQPGSSVLHFVKAPLAAALFLMGLFGFFVVRASLHSARRLAEAHRMMLRLSSAIEQTHSAVFIANRSGTLEYANSKFLSLFQHHPDEKETQKLSELFPVEKYPRLNRAFMSAFNEQLSWAGEFEHQTVDGAKLWVHSTVSPIKEGTRCSHVVCVTTDVSTMKQAFDEMAHLASHDVLTGLLNRRLFNELLEQATHLAKRDTSRYAMLYLDLDGFKEINDTLGHSVGDQLLIEVAERLKDSVRESDVVARVGGDEFIVLLQNIGNRSDVEQTAINILSHLAQPLKINGYPIRISASTGIALIPDDGIDPQQLTRRADLALYQGKQFGGNTYHFFGKEMETNEWQDKA